MSKSEINSKKIKLIYIASNGRSGSTLLDMLLGAHPNMWTLGEFHNLPWELIEQRQACGCGQDVATCSFWKKVINKHQSILSNGSIHHFREGAGRGKVLRLKEIWDLYFKKMNRVLSHEKRSYAKENEDVIKYVMDIAREYKDVEYVVDASKDPYRLFWLYQSGIFDIHAIHIVKDPRAYVYSMTKNDAGNLKKTFRMSIRYVFENQLIKKVIRRLNTKHAIQIRYEDLALNPEKVMKNILKQLDINSDNYKFEDFRGINHAVSGNAMRFESRGIKLDEKWKDNLSPRLQWVIKLLTRLSAKRFGYN
jgi:hypothetical protein